ncbi:hypothetical protein T01_16105 [Trichinella spiralis]|uniref:Uncharacterized protein n=1 Tax=Trichinella spiralis TaxID=6334 RepID=A0A0V1AJM1_TRISP|nr:hypothetical protein T01_16105 [Trichinella spiralis]
MPSLTQRSLVSRRKLTGTVKVIENNHFWICVLT